MVSTSVEAKAPALWRRRLAARVLELGRSHPRSLQTALLLVLTWPGAGLEPRGNLDPSYQFALQLAARDSMHFGHDLVFTYGPLGFLPFPQMYVIGAALWSLLTRTLVMALICGVTLRAMSRVLKPGWAFLAAYAFVSTTASLLLRGGLLAEAAGALVTAVAVAVLTGRPLPTVPRRLVLSALGVAASMLLMTKVNNGLYAGVAGLVTSAAAARWLPLRHRTRLIDMAVFAASAVVSLATGWLVIGQRVGDLPSYVFRSLEITKGYSASMSIELPRSGWQYSAALVVTVMLLIAVIPLALRVSRRLVRPEAALAAYAVLVLSLFALFKHGFVRHDGHELVFFTCLPIAALGILRRRNAAWVGAAIVTSIVVSWSSPNQNLLTALNPFDHLRAAIDQTETLLSSSKRTALQTAGREQMQREYGLDDRMRQLLVGTRLHVDPWETGVLFAYPGSSWAPVPVFQSYAAYTGALDRLNAEALASPTGPTHVLRQPKSVDGRNIAWQSPEYLLQMVCNFRQVYSQKGWYLLERQPNRCGATSTISTVKAEFGKPVPIPPTSSCAGIRTVRFEGLLEGFRERIVDFAYKVDYFGVHFDGGPLYRLMPLTGSGRHVLTVPGNPEWVQAGDDLAPLKAMKLVRIDRGNKPLPGGGTAKVIFECVSYAAVSQDTGG